MEETAFLKKRCVTLERQLVLWHKSQKHFSLCRHRANGSGTRQQMLHAKIVSQSSIRTGPLQFELGGRKKPTMRLIQPFFSQVLELY